LTVSLGDQQQPPKNSFAELPFISLTKMQEENTSNDAAKCRTLNRLGEKQKHQEVLFYFLKRQSMVSGVEDHQ
jgi:hypothetical protein